jgi:membrane protein DedA with SNARE-associated domain
MEGILMYLTQWIVNMVNHFGYFGIIITMAIESSLIPLPSEIIMIPAGMLARSGQMNYFVVIASGVIGSYVGSLANYILADFCGRPIIIKYGKYFLLPPNKLHKMELFFKKYGGISIFIGRLLPVVRHFISIPAGLAKMNIYTFTMQTIAGSTIWMIILTSVGYYIGNDAEKMHTIMPYIKYGIIIIALFLASYYTYKKYIISKK